MLHSVIYINEMIALRVDYSEGEVLDRRHAEVGVPGELPVLAGKKHGLGTEGRGGGVRSWWLAAHLTGLHQQGAGACQA